ncbi:DUF3052 family protein [Oceanomicrobium pacificus]|uniref:DUF3052 family protein n=1 Tax=Oceanomicrobium pacificus TaxID=2692916 RepID=A0A6B0TTJ3_9RHOB|nr:DUF3052 family protein [Oceanomicrobium pacificus]MXU66099.1 DUF3052 family protein [Oceanomicrobium pacificus]
MAGGGTSGYSSRPLAAKLGYASGLRIAARNMPDSVVAAIADTAPGLTYLGLRARNLDALHLFHDRRAALARDLTKGRTIIRPAGMIWVSWPKRAAGVPTDITEDVIRELALPMGLVDVKVCAVDNTWSGLKLVIRKELRGG